jgi:hypothetical protein
MPRRTRNCFSCSIRFPSREWRSQRLRRIIGRAMQQTKEEHQHAGKSLRECVSSLIEAAPKGASPERTRM